MLRDLPRSALEMVRMRCGEPSPAASQRAGRIDRMRVASIGEVERPGQRGEGRVSVGALGAKLEAERQMLRSPEGLLPNG